MIAPGTRLGPYEVLDVIGAGGMGEVYKGRDTRLDRSVAIKVLPPHLSGDPGFRMRFEREARVISSLNHPHICALHDVGQQDGVDYLVMEYCDGESLADRLTRGPLPVDQLLRIGIQVADALDRAHRSGITHRDLKPGNIMLTKAGAKLLDFGLAKGGGVGAGALAGSAAGEVPAATLAKPLTQEGSIVGTFQYMAPEQIEGQEADARSDIFAFGAILYEMATGKRAFDGKTKASLIASILDRDPQPISDLQPLAPPALQRVITTALAKDPDERWQSAHDVAAELKWISEAGSQAGVAAPLIARRKNRERLAWSLAIVAALGAIAALTALAMLLNRPIHPQWTSLVPPPKAQFDLGGENCGSLTISPDGHMVTFAAAAEGGKTQLWIRPLDSPEARALAGTEGATFPFWSPDSRFLAFFAEGKLKKIDIEGGPALSLCDVQVNPRSGSWSRDGVIIFSPSSVSPIDRVSAAGGPATPVTKLAAGESTHRWATFLPDGKHFLYMAGSHSAGTRSERNVIYAGSIDGTTRKLVLHARTNPVLASGHLLYVRDGVLLAQKFDAGKLEVVGDPVPIAQDVQADPAYFHGSVAASEKGSLVYRVGGADPRTEISWIDRNGKEVGTVGEKDRWQSLSLSPDGKRFAGVLEDAVSGTTDIWIYDLVRNVRTRLTFGALNETDPVWSPDGSRIVYSADREQTNASDLYSKAASGEGHEELLFQSPDFKTATDFSPDGRYLAFDVASVGGQRKGDVWILPLFGDKKPFPFLHSEFSESALRFSPDGKWVSYASDESGRNEVYITPFPGPGGKWQVSNDGGGVGFWTRGGKEMVFPSGSGLWAVDLSPQGSAMVIGNPRRLFFDPLIIGGDMTKDGERILAIKQTSRPENAPITLLTNWTAVLK